MKTINKVKEFEYVGNNSCGVEGYKTYSEFFFDKKKISYGKLCHQFFMTFPVIMKKKRFRGLFHNLGYKFSRRKIYPKRQELFRDSLKKKVDFEIDLRMDSWKTSELIKEFLKQIRPFGACREGEFSSVETDIPFTDEVTSSDDGWSYKQYDYSVKSEILILRVLHRLKDNNFKHFQPPCFDGKNVGPNTLSRVFSALRNIKCSDHVNELIDLLKN